ncbi:MAG: DUF4038 domain-containing protein [Bacteroidales bacterium]|nr:DUF4038 domain-containing protein [Bacteroidales bacterium]
MKSMIRAMFAAAVLMVSACSSDGDLTPPLTVTDNGRYLATKNGDSFFWLGDTGWLLFRKLNREEALQYLDDRKEKGFNVIQAVLVHDIRNNTNIYGDSAIVANSLDRPLTTEGTSPDDPAGYDYWDHVDYIVRQARERGIYMALLPVWGSNVRSGRVTAEQARNYARWLAERYRKESNIIWVNGGDVRGSDSTAVWNAIGTTLREGDPGHLITFHPFGRTQSSEWFHNAPWLDFNMFQSGHKRYDQDTTGLSYGEDNWRYMQDDWSRTPVKPSLDGEPSYEAIPQGLHDPSQPYWGPSDVRRYAWWSVFAGACGFTYGHNAVMQFHKPGDENPAYGVKEYWDEALDAPGSSQLIHLKELILSKPFFDRVPSQELLTGVDGTGYYHIAVTRGEGYALAYTCNGSVINIDTDKLGWREFEASWLNPADGTLARIGTFGCRGPAAFDPPGDSEQGNDWVLIINRLH